MWSTLSAIWLSVWAAPPPEAFSGGSSCSKFNGIESGSSAKASALTDGAEGAEGADFVFAFAFGVTTAQMPGPKKVGAEKLGMTRN